jgi:hypothetical protein
MDAMNYPHGDLPTWLADQIRTSIATNLAVIDESHVLAYMTGLFMAHSATCMNVPCSYGHPRYMASIIYTIEAALPLLDGTPDTSDLPPWSPEPAPEIPPPDPPEAHRRRLWPWR